jgi:superfamily II DNA helicase RecQ
VEERITERIVEKGLIGKPGIIFVNTQKGAKNLASSLAQLVDMPCLFFHGGLAANKKKEIQDKFMNEEPSTSIMCATNSFGCGVDKDNIAFVYHSGMSSSLLDYAQETGRAARVGNFVGDCCLFTEKSERNNFVEYRKSVCLPSLLAKKSMELDQMVQYITVRYKNICQRKYIRY